MTLASSLVQWVAVATFVLALWQYRANVQQTIRDFRWKQAEKAKEFGDALLTGNSMEALNLIDYPDRKYKVRQIDEEVSIKTADALNALAETPQETNTPKEFYIRDCFDDLLNKLDRIFALIEIKYVLWPDVAVVLSYYLNLLRTNQAAFEAVVTYCDKNGNSGAKEIISNDKGYPIAARNSPPATMTRAGKGGHSKP